MLAATISDGKPCFLKECFDTLAGDGVIKVDKMEDYKGAVRQITKGKEPQLADTSRVEQHRVIRVGHPGQIGLVAATIFSTKALWSPFIIQRKIWILLITLGICV